MNVVGKHNNHPTVLNIIINGHVPVRNVIEGTNRVMSEREEDQEIRTIIPANMLVFEKVFISQLLFCLFSFRFLSSLSALRFTTMIFESG